MKRVLIVVAVFAMVATACAEGDVATDDEATTTTVAATTTTETATTTSTTTAEADGATTTTAGDRTGEPSAFNELVARVESAPPLTSGRMEATISITGLDTDGTGPTDVSFGFETAFDTDANASSFVMDLSSLASAMPTDSDDPFAGFAESLLGTMEVRQIGDTAYVKMPLFNELLGVETPWLSMTAEEGDGFTSDMSTVPSDPKDVMTAYDGAAASVEDLGTETVNGVDTTHHRVSFDTTEWLDELSPSEQAELEASGLLADGILPMDVWVSPEGHLVRLVLALDGTTVDAPPGEGFEAMTVRYDLLDLGRSVVIEAPPASDVTSVDDLGFGDFDFGFEA